MKVFDRLSNLLGPRTAAQVEPQNVLSTIFNAEVEKQGRGGGLPPVPSNARDLGEDRRPVPGWNR